MSLLVGLLLILAALIAVAATRPKTFRIERSIGILAPAERVHTLLNDFKAWKQWSPWEDKDPHLKRHYSGAESGPGARYAWSGNREVGDGEMEILESVTGKKVLVDLHFLKPFEARNHAEFSLEEVAGKTQVTWAMYGPQSMMARFMSIFFSMEKMVGPDFEKGLSNLKHRSESAHPPE
jgi:uncharacterized protein YndB with AHSA1/START domain